MYDITFYTHANPRTGFGHTARCINLSKLLRKKDKKINISFSGSFSKSSLQFIKNHVDVEFKDGSSIVAVHDRMDDTENPEVYSKKYVKKIIKLSKKLVFLANGRTNPDLPSGALTIGYKIGGPKHNPPNLLWGFNYAPVSIEKIDKIPYRLKHNIFVALGGSDEKFLIFKVLKAISLLEDINTVDILQSPVNSFKVCKNPLRTDQILRLHKNLPSIKKNLLAAGIVLASYGHLAYEAIASGAPICLVGQKKFQVEFAKYLEDYSLCISAGLISEISEQELALSIQNTLSRSTKLSSNSKNILDGLGLHRITDILLQEIKLNK